MQLKFVTTFLFLFFFVCSFSQNTTIDYSSIQTDSISKKSIKVLQKLALHHLKNDLNKARVYAIAYLKKVKEEDSKKYLSHAYYTRYLVEEKSGNYALAYINIKKTISHYQNNKPQTIIKHLMKKGNLESLLVLNEEAIKTFSQALDISYEIKDVTSQAFINDNITIIKLDIGNYFKIEDIEKVFKKNQAYYVKEYAETKKELYLIASVKSLSYLGLISIYKYDYANAVKIYEHALDICNQHDLVKRKVVLLCGLANAYTRSNRNFEENELALDYLTKAEKTAYLNHQKEYISLILLLKGRALYNQEKYQEAIEVLLAIEKKPLPNAKDIEIQEFLSILTKCYLKLDDLKNAKLRLEQYTETRKKNEHQKVKLANRVFQKIDLKEATQKIETLEENLIERDKKTFFLISLIFLLLVIVFLIIFFFRKRQGIHKDRFKALIENVESKSKIEKTETTTHIISDKKVHEILAKLTDFENKKLFRNNKYTLSSVAKKLNTNSSYLSKIINSHKKKTFTEYIAELRINDIVERLQKNAKLRSFTMQSIAEEAGFRKAQSFSKAFKNHTGIYPSFFIKEIDNQQNKHL